MLGFFKKNIAGPIQYRCFPVTFAKILRAPFFTEQFRWMFPQNFRYVIKEAYIGLRHTSTMDHCIKYRNFT